LTKSSVKEIRERFDHDVERFSSLDVGQTTIVDAPLLLDLVAQAAAASNPDATHLLDIGCGAGNYTLKLLGHLPHLNVTLVDLSQPMLERAAERVRKAGAGDISVAQADVRELRLGESRFDIIVAAAVFHHLRGDAEWTAVFSKCYAALKPGGSIWIADLVQHSTPPVQSLMWERYGEYLSHLDGDDFRDHVFGYIEREDTPRSLLFQIDRLRQVGFRSVEVLHKNSCFAAFGAIK
jgi:tRNA (cmo5U34)-methyltransferase